MLTTCCSHNLRYASALKHTHQNMARKLLWLFVLAVVVDFIRCYPFGPPGERSVCNDLIPADFSPHRKQAENGKYLISTNVFFNGEQYVYLAGRNYVVEVKGIEGATFRGFIVQAWAPDDAKIGTFALQNAQQQLVNCNRFSIARERTIAHDNNGRVNFISQVFRWIAPSSSNGLVDFRFTVVRIQTEFFGIMSAAALQARASMVSTRKVPITTDRLRMALVTEIAVTNDVPVDTETTTTKATTSGVPETVTDPDRDPEDYRITARFPNGCAVSECTVFVGIDTNTGESNYLDIYLEGTAQAWVAVGFSESPNMFSADVLACNVNPNTNMVEALDTWNDQTQRFNVVDDIQNVYLRSGIFANGRIQCTMVREIAGSEVSTRDLNLNRFYYLLYGVGMIESAGFLSQHDFGIGRNPQVSNGLVSLSLGRVSFGDAYDIVSSEVPTIIERVEVSTTRKQVAGPTIIEKVEVRTIDPRTEFGKAGEVRMTSASWLMVSVLFLYSWALRV